MNSTDWREISNDFAAIDDARRDTVFVFIRERLRAALPQSLLDYGAGDGSFAALCAEAGVRRVVAYDLSPGMVRLAERTCGSLPGVSVVASTRDLPAASFEVVTLNAVWMCLATTGECLSLLRDIHRLLAPGGRLIASVTHPCFRSFPFSTYETDFNPADYLRDGTLFTVRIHDGVRDLRVVDTHWSLSAMSAQLRDAGFVVEELAEIGDREQTAHSGGCPWLLFFARKGAVSHPDERPQAR